jgi:hypothetical protein
MRNRSSIPLIVFPLLLLFNGCRQQPPAAGSGLPTVDMKIGSGNYHLEIAADEYARARGLMERDSMPAGNGMIFVFDTDTNDPFWMHNTRIPLDILFIDHNGKVISVQTMKPYDESNTLPGGMYRYAIELNAGATAKNGVKTGDIVQIPPAALHP